MSDSTPTEKFDAPVVDAPESEAKISRTLLYVLIGIGALLLIAVIVLIATLAGRANDTVENAGPTPTLTSQSPSPEATASSPSPTPTIDETEAPEEPAPAEPTGARFKSFDAQKNLDGCSPGGPGFDATYPAIKVSWSTAGADEAWIVMGTSDAADSQFMQIPLNGDQNDFQYPLLLPCSEPSTTYTITLVAPNGDHVQKHFTVNNTGEQF